MPTFTIDSDNNITAFPTPDDAKAPIAGGAEAFASQDELEKLAGIWPAGRLVAIWSSLPGVKPVKGFKSAKAAASRIWERVQTLGGPKPPKAERKPKGGAQAAKGAPAVAKATKKDHPPPRTRPNRPRRPKRGKLRMFARAARRPKSWPCSSGKTARPLSKLCGRWGGRSTRFAVSWPAR